MPFILGAARCRDGCAFYPSHESAARAGGLCKGRSMSPYRVIRSSAVDRAEVLSVAPVAELRRVTLFVSMFVRRTPTTLSCRPALWAVFVLSCAPLVGNVSIEDHGTGVGSTVVPPSAADAGGTSATTPAADGDTTAPPASPPAQLGGGSTESSPASSGSADAAEGTPSSTGVAGATGSSDAGVAPSPGCVLGAFQAPELLTGLEQVLNSGPELELWAPSLSPDGHTLLFAASDDADELIATATRLDRGSAFSSAAPLSTVNSAGQDGAPMLSADGLSLYFYSTREGGLGNRDVWLSTRPDVGADFTAPTFVAGVNGPDDDHLPWLSPDELTMLFETNRPGGVGGFDIWIARRAFRSDGFSSIAPLNAVNSASTEGRAVLGDDELSMYFASDRPGGMGSLDLWLATRSEDEGSFAQLTNLASLNSPNSDSDPFLSADGRELMFASNRDGRMRLWRSVRVCE